MTKITVRSVAALRPEAADTWMWDDEVKGFGVRVKPSGTGSFVVQYRTKEGGQTRRYVLGRVGVMQPEQARQDAKEVLVLVSRGEDPSETRKAARKAVTVAEVAEKFLTEHAERKRKTSTANGYRWLYERAIKPSLGSVVLRGLSRERVSRWYGDLHSTPILANRALALLSSICSWAVVNGYRPDTPNPTKGIERHRETSRERFLTAGEFGRLGDALRVAEETKAEPAAAINAIRTLAISGMRLSEVLNLRWSEVSKERRLLELADSKTGKKTVSLTAPMLQILDSVEKVQGNPYVFVGRKAGHPFVGLRRVWERMCKAAEIEGVRIHDLRHSAASVGAASGFSLLLLGKLLGHSHAATTAKYAHLAADPVRTAAEHVANQISGMMTGTAAQVIPLKTGTGTET